ncbi:MAG: hypothetical protein IT581_01455, partial [Verrucomicrobiales bacterium]|nr:hypothetical protein [Verrucomicrobiales bacterium]
MKSRGSRMSLWALVAWAAMFLGSLIESKAAVGSVQLRSPGNGAVNVPPCVTLQWSAASGATGYFYEVTSGGVVVASGGSGGELFVDLELSESTVYQWRVRGRTSASTGPWSATWSFTTKGPIPAPTLSSPSNGASNFSMNVLLQWQPVSSATGYEYEVYQAGGGLVGSGLVSDSASPGVSLALFEGDFVWRVRGRTSCRNGFWSATWGFTIPPIPAPALVSPANGAIDTGATLSLMWQTVNGATAYEYEVSDGAGVVVSGSGNPGVSVTVPSAGAYTWRVRGKTSLRNGAWSATWGFDTRPPIGVPVQVSPANGADEISMLPTLQWQSAANATGYDYEVSRGTTLVASGSSGGLQVTLTSPLTQDTTYNWRVRGKTSAREGTWSGSFNFTTRGPIPAPVLVSPANGA